MTRAPTVPSAFQAAGLGRRYPQPAASHLCHSQGQGLGTWAPAARGPSGASGAAWCKRGARLSEAHMVSQLPTAPFFIQPRPLGHAQGCRETVSYGRWGIRTGRARGFWGWRVRARTAESTAPLYDAGVGAEPHGDHPSASLCKVLQVLCHLVSSVPSSRSGWQSCPCFAHTLQGLLPLLRPVPTSC